MEPFFSGIWSHFPIFLHMQMEKKSVIQSCRCCVFWKGVPVWLFAVVIGNRTDPGSAEPNCSIRL